MRVRVLAVVFAIAVFALACPALAEMPAEIRVITYNIHHGEGEDGKFDLARIAKVLIAEKPDIVALQEVDQKTQRASGVDQPAEIARLTGMEVVFGHNIDIEGGGYGTAVLTRLPVRSSESVKLKSFYTSTKEHPEQRGVQVIELGAKDEPGLLFLCTHLDARKPDDERMNSALTIDELIKTHGNQPAILAGDLNSTPESRVVREFAKEWTIAGWRTNVGSSKLADNDVHDGWPVLTYPSENPRKWIDYVMYRPTDRWKWVEVRVLDERVASDHRPLLAVLRRLP